MAPNTLYVPNTRKKLSRVYPECDGDEIVISGMSGRFPSSHNVAEFEYNLYNKVDMVNDEERRWKHLDIGIPKRYGTVYDLEKFDATFFGVHFKQANSMDPQCRILLECSYEAVLDAGVNPKSLRGTRTGVYVGACFSESDKTMFYEKSSGFGITGCSKAMLANRISYVLGLNGPSYMVDTACSSSLHALDSAFSAFRNGEIDAAIVGGCNLILHPYVTLQFAKLGFLAMDGYCRPFDQDASGYTRSEAISCIFLQRKQNANRIYASLIYSKIGCDGYKDQGITYPSGVMQEKLLREFYDDLKFDMNNLGYIEAHSTGTFAGDPEECKAINNAICCRRNSPLLIGSVKSNIGHSEPASGLCSIVKVLLAFQNGRIAPNINFKHIRKDIKAFVDGKLKVVDEITDLRSPYAAINAFGFGGANSHVLLRRYSKKKQNCGIPEDTLPRLVLWSGRTEESVNNIFSLIEQKPLDKELVGLLNKIQNDSIPGFVFRGYGLYSHTEGKNAQCLSKNTEHYTGLKRPIVWVFSGMGSQWSEMGTSLMNIPIFKESIYKCHDILKPKGLDLINILTSKNPEIFENILHSFVGIAAIQIGIIDILKKLEFTPDYIIGHSVGELGCAYADDSFTAEQMILSAYFRGKVSLEIDKIHGSMAAVGVGYKKIISILPSTIDVACHNSNTSCTLSGPAEDVAKFVAYLKDRDIFAKEVPCSHIAYHSRYISHMGPTLLKYLNEIIPSPKPRSSKWLSTSVPKSQWEQPGSKLCSAEYYTNNLLSSVLFEETVEMLPQNCLTIEIAPHALLQAIIRKSMSDSIHIGLTQRGNSNNDEYFLTALGKLFVNGADIPVERLYPAIEFPVSVGTPSISSCNKWDHKDNWFVINFENITSEQAGERSFKIGLNKDDDRYLGGHNIDGRVLMPATGYLQLVWETFSLMQNDENISDMSIEFENVKFLRAIKLVPYDTVTLKVMIHYGTGHFEVTESRMSVVIGKIRSITKAEPPKEPHIPESKDSIMLETKSFYKELRLRGYYYNNLFRGVVEARNDGLYGKVRWNYNWVTFTDSLLQLQLLGSDTRDLMLPTRIKKLLINGKYLTDVVSKLDPEKQVLDVFIDKKSGRIVCDGLEIIGLHSSVVGRRKTPNLLVLEKYQFIPNLLTPTLSKIDAIRVCVQLALENNLIFKMKVVEVDLDKLEPIVQHFQYAFQDLPLVSGSLMFLSQQKLEPVGVHVENGKLSTQINCMFVISSRLLSRPQFLEQCQNSMHPEGYIISREQANIKLENVKNLPDFNIIAILPTDNEVLILMQRPKMQNMTHFTIVNVSELDTNYSWIKSVQSGIENGPVVLVSYNEKFNGLLGMVNCLRKEPDGHLIRCIIVDDKNAPKFDINLPFYKNQLNRGLAINIYKNGKWGTYRHLQLSNNINITQHKYHVYANMSHRGDLSSFNWLQGPLHPNECKIKVVYSSLNFRDVMQATGRLNLESDSNISRIDQQNLFGFEFSGVGNNGTHYMGMINSGAVASHLNPDMKLVFEVPNEWNLREAATVPVVYITVYWAYFFTANIRRAKTILIHAGSGGVGLAAIRVALAYGLDVYTTVSSSEKKNFLLKVFPKLKESQIGNSRDTSFEEMIKIQTDGKGVDFVLNSLSGDKLVASLRCLAERGQFAEIGKFDMANDNQLGLRIFLNELSFHAILIDKLFEAPTSVIDELRATIYRDISAGIIKPLPFTIFKASEIEQAFRHMASDKHFGKILLQIREDGNATMTVPLKATPQVYFNSRHVYVIPGGLGGFGLELVNWMIMRGARKFILSSKRGISKSYQAYRLKIWKKYGAEVYVRIDDITTRRGCENLLKEAVKLGPIGGIFNLAVTLKDAVFANQTHEKFAECMGPKAIATKYLDELSRKMCPNLQHFVIFSSVSCGRGNAGQTNYGMANSVMERVIEERSQLGFPAKAIQWGVVGEVGILAEMTEEKIDLQVDGILQQRIASCLHELDILLISPDPIVSSMVIPEKSMSSGGKKTIIEAVMNAMGLRDFKTLPMSTRLSEIGMDSLTIVEVKQILEKEFGTILTLEELPDLRLETLKKMSKENERDGTEIVKLKLASDNKPPLAKILLWASLGDEFNSDKVILPLTERLGSINSCLIIPGFEGVGCRTWSNIAIRLRSKSYILQLTKTVNMTAIEDIAKTVDVGIKQNVFIDSTEPFYIISYSFGAVIALQLAKLLEEAGYAGQILLIDGAPAFLKRLCTGYLGENVSDHDIQIMLFTTILKHLLPDQVYETIAENFKKLKSWDEKINELDIYLGKQNIYSKEYVKNMLQALYNRIKIVVNMDLSCTKKISSNITLVRPSEVSITDIDHDYELPKYTTGKITVKFLEGNHTTILENPKLTKILNQFDPSLDANKDFEEYLAR